MGSVADTLVAPVATAEVARPSRRAGSSAALGLAIGVGPPNAYGRPDEQGVWRATGREDPVFLDRSGRRRPLLAAVGAAVACAGAGWLAALVAGTLGFTSLPTAPELAAAVRPAVRVLAPQLVGAPRRRAHHSPGPSAHRRGGRTSARRTVVLAVSAPA